MPKRRYRGRFAPSPTGDLHFGSLVAAVGSYLQARSRGGEWLIRVENIDPPREVPGSTQNIIHGLAKLGLESDETILMQSTREAAYQMAAQKLLNQGKAFWCGCSRRDLPESGIYPGSCREGIPQGKQARTIRLRVQDETTGFYDRLQGNYSQNLGRQVGDFVIRRADLLYAYQLAVVVDDAYQGITEVVRGLDLLDSTPRQIFLQQKLGLPTPDYIHLPLALDQENRKLSKRFHADPIDLDRPVATITSALAFLGHKPPPDISGLDTLWSWAISHWSLTNVPAQSVQLVV